MQHTNNRRIFKILLAIGIGGGLIVFIMVRFVIPFFPILIVLRPAPSVKSMKTAFEKNRDSIERIVDMFQTVDFHYSDIVSIDEDYHYITVHDNHSAEPYAYNDEKVYTAFKSVFNKSGCYSITKENNCIFFHWWDDWGSHAGIVYSMDGEMPNMEEDLKPKVEQTFEPLGYENWYYYYSHWP